MVVNWTNFTGAGAIRDLSVTVAAMRIVMATFGGGKLTALLAPIIVRRNSIQALPQEKSLDHSTLVIITEAILRVILGWRMLISGLSNAPLAQSGEYREHLIPKGRDSFRFRRDISNGRRRFRARRGYTDSYFGGHDRHFSDPDLCFALALVESFADDGAGREGSAPG